MEPAASGLSMWVQTVRSRGLPVDRGREGFTLVEVMMAVAVMGVMLIGLYGGLGYGFKQIQLAREDERATQIMAERMEVVRLLSWDQLVNLPGYVPTNYTESYSLLN